MYGSNVVGLTNVYPTAGRGTIGDMATSPFEQYGEQVEVSEKEANVMDRALAIGMAGEPIKWWLSLVVLLALLMYFSQKYDGEGSYANLRLSAYNIVTITIAAIIGMSIFKVAATKFPVPGLSTVILAA